MQSEESVGSEKASEEVGIEGAGAETASAKAPEIDLETAETPSDAPLGDVADDMAISAADPTGAAPKSATAELVGTPTAVSEDVPELVLKAATKRAKGNAAALLDGEDQDEDEADDLDEGASDEADVEMAAEEIEPTEAEIRRLMALASKQTADNDKDAAALTLDKVIALAANRAELLTLTFRCAPVDPIFQPKLHAGNEAMARQAWGEAEYLYWQALQRFPLHTACLVTYGHALREQGKVLDSELPYRAALALGADPEIVVPFLNMTLDRLGVARVEAKTLKIEGLEPSELPPLPSDLDMLAELLWGQGIPVYDKCQLLRTCKTCDDAMAAMVKDHRFQRQNLQFLALLSAKRAEWQA